MHLAHRDVTFVCVSRARYAKLAAYKTRMRWTFPWYSSAASEFNADFGVSFTPEQQERGGHYNFTHLDQPPEETPGLSAFAIDVQGQVLHTYSTYSRGLDPLNTTYQLLDLAPADATRTTLRGPWSGSDATTPTTSDSTSDRWPTAIETGTQQSKRGPLMSILTSCSRARPQRHVRHRSRTCAAK